jgi:hypothetical protein
VLAAGGLPALMNIMNVNNNADVVKQAAGALLNICSRDSNFNTVINTCASGLIRCWVELEGTRAALVMNMSCMTASCFPHLHA